MGLGMSASRARGPAFQIAGAALTVCLAYYVGANLGFILRFPPATPSIMWPPNAILTATLLLAPPRRWWIYLLAALPAHLAAELGAGWPAPLVLALFLTNCSEALIAAVGVRWFSDAPTRFDTLRRVVVFIVAAVLAAPFLSSFLDAAAVSTVRGESYWFVWQTRFFSNVLTELTLVPAVVMAITAGPVWHRTAPRSRRFEAGLLAASLLLVGTGVFLGPIEGADTVPGTPGTSVAFLLPFILWAAVRFGPGGASGSLLTTTLLAIWAATHGRGPFTGLALAESVHALQMFLTIVAIPLMCLAALIDERRRTQEALQERLLFEEMLSRLSGAFVHLPGHEMDAAFETWLARLGEFLRLDRVLLFRLSADQQEMVVAYSWIVAGAEPVPRVTTSRDFPGLFDRILRGEQFVFSSLAELPAEAAREAESFRRRGIRSNLAIPLEAGGRILGGLGLATLSSERAWPEDLVQRLRLVAEVFASALARREAVDDLRASELMKSAILASLASSVAVLDHQGGIIAVNDSWTRLASEKGTWEARLGLGDNYIDVCRKVAGDGDPYALEAMIGIEGVLDRSRPVFALEYGCGAPVADRWFALSVLPLNRLEGGAVISHTEVTERKRAELDALRSRQELAHFTRISTIGELTASLAHELNQPLTGILINAQTARRLLDVMPPRVAELRESLSYIIEDDKRAGEVIQRLRDFLGKGESQRVLLDLNLLIQGVTKLVSSDALIRNVTLTLDLDPELPRLTGDRVQLQQVVLNLLLNAMEAMGAGTPSERLVVARSQRVDAKTVRVSVQDNGTGLPAGLEDVVFDPFYTTKSGGMGMGLAIARSIIEAHAGGIWATNNATHGATFHFNLPLTDERAHER
jgi:signal transduction histidine kinase/integral membrane sensor domain MASE1